MQKMAELIDVKIKELLTEKSHLVIAIDGRCAAGKTTLAAHLQTMCACNVIHMDHFFLRPEQRTSERLQEAGGNVDYERFLEEVLLPLEEGETFSYCPYSCKTQSMADAIEIKANPVTIVEGSYSCHPVLSKHYDMRIFLDVDGAEQMRRIELRNGRENAVNFKEKWIPLEERYFVAYPIEAQSDLAFCACGKNSYMIK